MSLLGFLLIRRARQAGAPLPSMRVVPGDADYADRARREAEFWTDPPFGVALIEAGHSPAMKRFTNRSYTGDPETTWMEDLAARGPFRRAAVLGCTEGLQEERWLRLGASRQLDVFDLSPGALERTRRWLWDRSWGFRRPRRDVNFFLADLNFIRLPRRRYDLVWSSGSLHHVTNLEYVVDQVEASLRPGGLFALHDYVGEPNLVYDEARLEQVNRVFRNVPPRFRRIASERIDSPVPADKSPFEAIRADETLAAIGERFERVHVGGADALFPLFVLLDLEAMEREAPDLLEQVFAAENEARRQAGARLCSVYAVFRKRA